MAIVFSIFKKMKSIAKRNQIIDFKMQIAQSHGWLLDEIDDSDSFYRSIVMTKEILIKPYLVFFKGGRSQWSTIYMRLLISHDNVKCQYDYALSLYEVAGSYDLEHFTGTRLKKIEDSIAEIPLDLTLGWYLDGQEGREEDSAKWISARTTDDDLKEENLHVTLIRNKYRSSVLPLLEYLKYLAERHERALLFAKKTGSTAAINLKGEMQLNMYNFLRTKSIES